MPGKIKILHILWSGNSGGPERFVYEVTAHLDRDRFESAVCFLSGGGWIADKIKRSGIKVYCLGMENGLSLIPGMRILKVIKDTKPDIIDIHALNFVTMTAIALFSKIPKIYFEHGGDLIGERRNRPGPFYNHFSRFYSLILANSGFAKNRITKLADAHSERIKIFYPGVDPAVFNTAHLKDALRQRLGIYPGSKVLGVIGRLVESKGIDEFIKVAAEVKRQRPNGKYSFIVIGEGALESGLKAEASAAGVDIKFLGDRQDVPELLSIFDIFVFTSKWEFFGMVLLEALAAKVPVVGFKIDGAREIFEMGGGGVLIEGRDHHKLAEIIIDLLENDSKRKELAEAGYKNVTENFNIRKNIKRLEEEYISVFNRKA